MQRIIVSSGRSEVELVRLDEQVVTHVEVAEVARDVDVLAQRAADERDPPAGLRGDVHRLLHPVDVRGEGGDEHTAFPLRDQVAEDLADRPLGLGHAGPLGIRRVAQEEVDAAVSELGELAEVGAEAVHWCVVDLVVAGHHDQAARGGQRDRDRVRDRVRHADELGFVRADPGRALLGLDLDQLGAPQEPVLVELRLHEPEREARRPDLGNLDLAQEVRERADVVLVPVGEHDGTQVSLTVAQVIEVGQDEVDAEVLVPREGQSGVDDDDPLVAFDDGHVLADLAQAAERDDPCAPRHRRKCTFRYGWPHGSGARRAPRCSGRSARRPWCVWSGWPARTVGEVWLKLESANPTGSYKDRMALAMIEGAERSGRLRPARRSSSTRAAAPARRSRSSAPSRDIRSASSRRTRSHRRSCETMRAFGAELDVIPSPDGITPELIPRLMERAAEIVEDVGGYATDQFRNEDMIDGYAELGTELAQQLDGRVDAFCTYVGTAGCFLGVTRALRRTIPDLHRVVVEPSESPVDLGGPSREPTTSREAASASGRRCSHASTSTRWSPSPRRRPSRWPSVPPRSRGCSAARRPARTSLLRSSWLTGSARRPAWRRRTSTPA